MRRPFIVEGLDGSGKSTLVQSLAGHTCATLVSRLCNDEDMRIRKLIIDQKISVGEIHRLYMAAAHNHLLDVVVPKLASGEVFLIDRWVAGMLATHTLRGGVLVDWTFQHYDWTPIKEVDCLFVRASTDIRMQRARARGSLTISDEASFVGDAETIHLQFARRCYRRVIVLEASDLSREDLLTEGLRVVNI